MKDFTHLDTHGEVSMVDVSAKPVLVREATASGKIILQKETLERIAQDKIAKGNVLVTARLAGIQAAKQTSTLIPLCHGLQLSHAQIDFEQESDGIRIRCTAKTSAQTGVEMEALTGVSLSALTIYDMCKAVDPAMMITEVYLESKTKSYPVEVK